MVFFRDGDNRSGDFGINTIDLIPNISQRITGSNGNGLLIDNQVTRIVQGIGFIGKNTGRELIRFSSLDYLDAVVALSRLAGDGVRDSLVFADRGLELLEGRSIVQLFDTALKAFYSAVESFKSSLLLENIRLLPFQQLNRTPLNLHQFFQHSGRVHT